MHILRNYSPVFPPLGVIKDTTTEYSQRGWRKEIMFKGKKTLSAGNWTDGCFNGQKNLKRVSSGESALKQRSKKTAVATDAGSLIWAVKKKDNLCHIYFGNSIHCIQTKMLFTWKPPFRVWAAAQLKTLCLFSGTNWTFCQHIVTTSKKPHNLSAYFCV